MRHSKPVSNLVGKSPNSLSNVPPPPPVLGHRYVTPGGGAPQAQNCDTTGRVLVVVDRDDVTRLRAHCIVIAIVDEVGAVAFSGVVTCVVVSTDDSLSD